ncbi:MAG: FHA domain-containing protein [Bryobacteraceae bacterium]|jgi:hypothetical protein
MYQVLLTHLRGFRAGQTQKIEAGPDTVITLGRDPDSSTVSFDPDHDDLASRRHAKIVWDNASPSGFSIEDVASSNGTFVDGRRISGRTFLQSGQVMEFGRKGEEQGPAVRFEVDSPGGGRRPPAPTKMEPVGAWASSASPARKPSMVRSEDQRPSGAGPGKAPLAVVAVVILALIGGGFLAWHHKKQVKTATAAPGDLVGLNKDALAVVEVVWKLYDPVTGRQAYHWHIKNPYQASGLNGFFRGLDRVPVFVKLTDGSIEPVIMLSDERDTNLAMGGSQTGTGFVAHRAGFILTARSLAAPGRENYVWPAVSTPALLVELGRPDYTVLQAPPRWIPSHARFILTKPLSLEALSQSKVQGRSSALETRLDRLTVAFSGSPQRIAATVAEVSDKAPIALLKVSQVTALQECPLRQDETDVATGEQVRILTWGGQGGPGANAQPVTAITLNVAAPPNSEAEVAAQCKECIWLSDGASSAGNIGAPIYDAKGRVAAIFQTTQVSGQFVAFATPIRIGIGMMGEAH